MVEMIGGMKTEPKVGEVEGHKYRLHGYKKDTEIVNRTDPWSDSRTECVRMEADRPRLT